MKDKNKTKKQLIAELERLRTQLNEQKIYGVPKEKLNFSQNISAIYEYVATLDNDFLAFVDKNYIYQSVNTAYLKLWNKPLEKVVGKSVVEMHGKKVFNDVIKAFLDRAFKGEQFSAQYWMSLGNKRRLLQGKFYPYYENGQLVGVVVHNKDTTDLYQKDKELKTKTNRLASVMDSHEGGIWDWDIVTDEIYFSPQLAEIRGFSPSELEGDFTEWEKALHPDDRPQVLKRVQDCLEGRTPVYFSQHRLTTKSGGWIWVVDRGKVVEWDENGNPTRMTGTDTDITDAKKAEVQLKLQAEILNSMLEGVNVSDERAHIVFTNPAFDKMFGYESGELLDQSVFVLNQDASQDKAGEVMYDLDRFGFWEGEFNSVKKDGTPFISSARINPFLSEGKKYFISVQSDVTEQKEMEFQLRQAHKMESLGVMAGGVAHEFNNILGVVNGFSDLLIDSLPQGGAEKEYALRIHSITNRAIDLVAQILTFGKRNEKKLWVQSIAKVVTESVSMVRATLPKTIQLVEQIDKNCGPVLSNAGQLHQIILNICTNAHHAMEPGGGTIEIILKEVDCGECPLDCPSSRKNKCARLSIKDTGHGIPKALQEKIFDPFFSTKPVGKGTGLGLSVVHGIIEQHEGRIVLESEECQGTTFHIFFPISDQTIDEEKLQTETPHLGKGRILVVDDEPYLTEFYKIGLGHLGYEVTSFNDSREAWEAFQLTPDSFDLIFTDYTMPHLNGSQLSQNILKLAPQCPIILTTGFSHKMSEEQSKLLGIHAFMNKPVKIHKLAGVIQKLLK